MLTLPPSYKAIVLFTPGGDLVYSIDPSRRQHWHLDLCVAIQEVWHLPEPPHFLVPLYTATIDYQWDPQNQTSRIYAEAYPPSFPHRHLLNALFQLSSPPWRCLRAPQGQEDIGFLVAYRRQFPQLWERQDWVLNLAQVAQVRQRLAQSSRSPSLPWRRSPTHSAEPPIADRPNPQHQGPALPHESSQHAPHSSSGDQPQAETAEPWPLRDPGRQGFSPQPGSSPRVSGLPEASALGSVTPDTARSLVEAGSDLAPGDERDRGYVLRLFVAGHGSSTLMILQRLYGLLETHVAVPYTLKVVDIIKYPDQAEVNQVKAVPTLIRVWPEPTYRVVGYFERWEQLAQLFN